MGNAANVHVPPFIPEEVTRKYAQERDKRIRAEGNAQFVQIHESERFVHFAKDPWDAELEELKRTRGVRTSLENGEHTRILLVGGGYSGLVFAVRLLQAGFTVDDLIADTAGGFGGTWYWNRYPGLMCDVESYIYMPLLEELGYMPKHKYAAGTELRDHANAIAENFDLYRAACFKTMAKSMKWNENKKHWEVETTPESEGETATTTTITADFVVLGTGLFSRPKMPNLPGIVDFEGHTFHTSRWDYGYTGGSPYDPDLTNLKGKKVGIMGTGATSVQAIPQLEKWAKGLYVFQRTPSAVDRRDNRETDPELWAHEVTSRGPGWQRERMENYNAFVSNVTPPPENNMISDGWSTCASYCVLIGGPNNADPNFVSDMQAVDFTRQEKIRARVDEFVKDEATADSLKAWYPTRCKRPCFHDEYLPTFNQPHVKLVDTYGRGVSRLTENGLVVGDKDEYDLDLIIFGTGFSLGIDASPADRGGITVVGRGGEDMQDKWKFKGVGTLHGVVSRGFPNMFFPGLHQAATGPNWTFLLEI